MNSLRGLPLLLLLTQTAPLAKITEDVIDVPVSVSNAYGRSVEQTIKVTVFRDTERARSPYLVLNHGRAPNPADFAKTPRFRYSKEARYFVSLGFVVLVPTRVGYGESGGPDVEDSGSCDARLYEPVYRAAAKETADVLSAARALAYVDLSRGLVVGQSFGGATAVALASSELPGLVATVNFAGGGGGNPATHPGMPCSPARLKMLFSGYGKTARVPSLWLYSVNDRFWGPELPKEWFSLYQEKGGKARFVSLPAYGDNGHGIFSGDMETWRRPFEDFVHELGF